MTALDWLLALAALLGHFTLCVAVFNRLHGIGIHRHPRRLIEVVLAGWFVAAIVWYAWQWSDYGGLATKWRQESSLPWSAGYAELCVVAAAALLPYWLLPRLRYRTPAELVQTRSERIDVAARIGPIEVRGLQGKLLAAIPGNEIFHLEVREKTFCLPGLPCELDGLAIVHLSDLHFTGVLGQPYFDYVIDQANRLQGDLLIVSGDIVESVDCETWIGETLGRLAAPLGKFFVLGNHDKRMPDVPRVRRLLCEAGLTDVGGRWQHLNVRGVKLLLAGNELPWFPAPCEEELHREAARPDSAAFRLLVSHSPDQYAWARRHRFDLMLAGHNHGGQVCLPLLGPLISPSLCGTRYASGVFYEPPTLLHVSRGISGEHPIRLGCPPELVKLVLKSA